MCLPQYGLMFTLLLCWCFFRYFFEFLLAHHQQVAREIRDEYVDTMSKIYSAYFGGYIAKLMKLQVNAFMRITYELYACKKFSN